LLREEMMQIDREKLNCLTRSKIILFRFIRQLDHSSNEKLVREHVVHKNKLAMEDIEYQYVHFYTDSCGHHAQDNSKILEQIVNYIL
jgi:hypothetical protein